MAEELTSRAEIRASPLGGLSVGFNARATLWHGSRSSAHKIVVNLGDLDDRELEETVKAAATMGLRSCWSAKLTARKSPTEVGEDSTLHSPFFNLAPRVTFTIE
jgi:hypothetical protein